MASDKEYNILHWTNYFDDYTALYKKIRAFTTIPSLVNSDKKFFVLHLTQPLNIYSTNKIISLSCNREETQKLE